jgi:peptidoglycan-N-acetylglucosamine deacetylase
VDRRGFLAGIGLVAAGTVVGTGAGVLAEPALADAGPVARTFRPSGQTAAFAPTVAFRTAPSEKLVALTIDDGPTEEWTPQVLAMLAKHGVRATFFVVGSRAASDPLLVQRAAHAGHDIGNHTWAHSDLTKHEDRFVRDSLERTHELIETTTGRPPTVCRPPYGRIDSVGLGACAALGYDVAMWSDHITGSNAKGDVDTVLRQVSAGSIVLAHDGGPEPNATLMAQLDRLVGSLHDAGFSFATFGQLLSAS